MIDVERGICLSAVNLGEWENVPLVDELSKRFPGIVLENDAAAGLLANHWFQDFDRVPADFLYVALGQGIGCAQMSGGRLVRGQHFCAGEIGHLPAGSEGRLCSCGKTDCLQTWCGERGLLKSIADAAPRYTSISLAEVGERVTGDAILHSALKSALQPLAEKVATMVALTDPAALIVACREPSLAEIVPAMLSATLEEFGLPVAVISGLSPEEASLKGGAVAVFRKAFKAENLRL
ncbi:MAG: ROK family protein [Verrucomicrobiales bacterium]|nr:ROK family protein [Verrucomicrobiales bacterium]